MSNLEGRLPPSAPQSTNVTPMSQPNSGAGVDQPAEIVNVAKLLQCAGLPPFYELQRSDPEKKKIGSSDIFHATVMSYPENGLSTLAFKHFEQAAKELDPFQVQLAKAHMLDRLTQTSSPGVKIDFGRILDLQKFKDEIGFKLAKQSGSPYPLLLLAFEPVFRTLPHLVRDGVLEGAGDVGAVLFTCFKMLSIDDQWNCLSQLPADSPLDAARQGQLDQETEMGKEAEFSWEGLLKDMHREYARKLCETHKGQVRELLNAIADAEAHPANDDYHKIFQAKLIPMTDVCWDLDRARETGPVFMRALDGMSDEQLDILVAALGSPTHRIRKETEGSQLGKALVNVVHLIDLRRMSTNFRLQPANEAHTLKMLAFAKVFPQLRYLALAGDLDARIYDLMIEGFQSLTLADKARCHRFLFARESPFRAAEVSVGLTKEAELLLGGITSSIDFAFNIDVVLAYVAYGSSGLASYHLQFLNDCLPPPPERERFAEGLLIGALMALPEENLDLIDAAISRSGKHELFNECDRLESRSDAPSGQTYNFIRSLPDYIKMVRAERAGEKSRDGTVSDPPANKRDEVD